MASTSVVDIFMELLGHLGRQGKVGVGRAQERGRHELEIRQLKKDRSKRLEKLGREVMALVDGGELTHPGLAAHMAHIQGLDRKIQAEFASQLSGAEQDGDLAEE